MAKIWKSKSSALLLKYLFGDGSDGDLTLDGETVQNLVDTKQYRNLTLKNGALLLVSGTHFLHLRVSGKISLSGNSEIRAMLTNDGITGAPQRSTPGVGQSPGDTLLLAGTNTFGHFVNYGMSGGGGGGGGAVRVGGAGGTYLGPTVYDTNLGLVRGITPTNGGAANANGGNAVGADQKSLFEEGNFDYFTCPMMLGIRGGPGGSGGVDSVGTGSPLGKSGAGGKGGKGGGFFDIRAKEIEIEEGSFINCNGQDGENGGDATDSSNADANAGGGGAGSGGSAGSVRVLCQTISEESKSRITATGGTSGIGGVGCGTGKNGGNGAAGFNGLVAITALLANNRSLKQEE